ncbi:hypothetical protein BAS10_07230 [Elizabethkingia meningoseptica]|uniref:hypothetical protein n=1 Tax=Elizabethkingia meningoseptica TaxID=238 RepID=UPI0009995BAB|nr:hypothetical protein [Elizabethkingia meningoseptica]OPB96834.1 hypothetical protein BAS10_07230 [Elizabethkingia meningoseptica]
MNPFENKALRGFCGCNVNGFQPAVSYALDSQTKKLTVTDASAFAAGDSFKSINVWAIDSEGNEVTGHISAAAGNVVLDLSTDFNISDGFTISSTVVSTKRSVADLSVRGVGLALKASSGTLNNVDVETDSL